MCKVILACKLNLKEIYVIRNNRLHYWLIKLYPAPPYNKKWHDVYCWRYNCVCCVCSTQQQTPHEKTPQPLKDQNRVGRGDGACTVSRARADVGWHPTGRAGHHHVLHWQDHQVSAGRFLCLFSIKEIIIFVCYYSQLDSCKHWKPFSNTRYNLCSTWVVLILL